MSHGGILNNCEGALDILKPLLTEQTRFLTWLPLSHSYEHTVQFVQISVGAKIFYAESIEKLIDIKKDGSFRLNQKYFNYATGLTMTNENFNNLFVNFLSKASFPERSSELIST